MANKPHVGSVHQISAFQPTTAHSQWVLAIQERGTRQKIDESGAPNAKIKRPWISIAENGWKFGGLLFIHREHVGKTLMMGAP